MTNFVLDSKVKFLDPEKLLFASGLSAGQVVVDLGAGSGFYAQAAGKIVGESGEVYTVDILESALDHVSAEARLKGLRNVKTLRCDLERANSCGSIGTGIADMVILANVTHQIKNRENLFKEIYRLLKTGGKVILVEWNDQPSPIGPPFPERIKPTQVKQLTQSVALKEAGTLATDPYHYGLMFIK